MRQVLIGPRPLASLFEYDARNPGYSSITSRVYRTVTAIASIQSGRPISSTDRGRNLYYNGNADDLTASCSNDVDQPVFDIAGFYFNDAAVQTNGAVDLERSPVNHGDTVVRTFRSLTATTIGVAAGGPEGPHYSVIGLWLTSVIQRGAVWRAPRRCPPPVPVPRSPRARRLCVRAAPTRDPPVAAVPSGPEKGCRW